MGSTPSTLSPSTSPTLWSTGVEGAGGLVDVLAVRHVLNLVTDARLHLNIKRLYYTIILYMLYIGKLNICIQFFNIRLYPLRSFLS